MFPIILLIIFFILGWRGTWRRAITISLFGYAALIIASQHNAVISDMQFLQSIGGESNALQRSALGFALSLVIIFIALNMLFKVFWGDDKQSISEKTGLTRLSQGLIAGIVGWTLGVMLMLSIAIYSTENPIPSLIEDTELSSSVNIAMETSEISIKIIEPWLPDTTSVQMFEVLERNFSSNLLSPPEQPTSSPSLDATEIPPSPTAAPQIQDEDSTSTQIDVDRITLTFPEENAFISRGESEQYFSWNLDGTLAENQSFEIRFYKVGEINPQAPFGWVKETGQLINLNNLNSGGDYEWNVVIVQGTDGNWEEDVYESPRRSVKWEG